MKKMGLAILGLALSLGCSSSDSSKKTDKQSSETYSYEYTVKGASTPDCTTDPHTFKSKEEICAGLKDEALNNFCARPLREKDFTARSCPGSFDAPVTLPEDPSAETAPRPNPDSGTPPTPKPPVSIPSVPSGGQPSVPAGPMPAPQVPAVDPTAGWEQKLVVKSKEFVSIKSASCSDFLCLAWNLVGQAPVPMKDSNDPQFNVQKFLAPLAPGVVLECSRKTLPMMTAESGQATCQLSVDPSQSSEKASIRTADRGSYQVISVETKEPALLARLAKAMNLRLVVENRDEIELTGTDGQERRGERMSLTCQANGTQFSSCQFIGVIPKS